MYTSTHARSNESDRYNSVQPEAAFRVFSVYGQQVSSVQLLLIAVLLFVIQSLPL